MPRKKASRAPSRAKPTLPNDSMVSVDMEAEERQKKLDLLLKDFDAQVAERVAEMEKEMQAIQEYIRNIYRRDSARYSESTRNMLWKDYVGQSNKPKVAERKSVDDLLNSANVLLAAGKAKKGQGKRVLESSVVASATKSTRTSRQKNVLGNSQTDNLLPPPLSTARAPRSRKVNMDSVVTPAGQGIGNAHLASMIVTPKFDPRTPLPPGTVKRKPKLGEIAISLTGSPLQVSPKGWLATITADDINEDEETRRELARFHERVGQLLKQSVLS